MLEKLKLVFNKLLRPFIPGTYEYLLRNKEHILMNYTNKPRAKDVIIAMTTYGPRISFFEYAILSILNGTLLPEKMNIYVPQGFKKLLVQSNSFLKSVYDNGIVELIEMEVDYYCHSKYYYVFQAYSQEKDIVLCDDDVVYYKDWLSHLVHSAAEYPAFNVFAYKAVIVTTDNGAIRTYDDWIHCSKTDLGEHTQLYTEAVGGVFYRRGLFKTTVLDKELFLALVPKADDVWLWFCTWINQGKVKFVLTKNNQKLQYIIPNSQEVALWKENTFGKRNDGYVLACRSYFRDTYQMDIIDFL
ncbi:hypothetical protein [Sphingobacterium rhinopitheci]|uniref:hypothetical protein n=1 Tax=Sphingobacterium rhinopitheci TaxID=2781960 RepID=UPI001F5213BD|nr:hypothetical protein [Sphingobacterium rhinopitheci]MCI0920761.1 hypothetical protein [Sphingobacterium rhinopitheci]